MFSFSVVFFSFCSLYVYVCVCVLFCYCCRLLQSFQHFNGVLSLLPNRSIFFFTFAGLCFSFVFIATIWKTCNYIKTLVLIFFLSILFCLLCSMFIIQRDDWVYLFVCMRERERVFVIVVVQSFYFIVISMMILSLWYPFMLDKRFCGRLNYCFDFVFFFHMWFLLLSLQIFVKLI